MSLLRTLWCTEFPCSRRHKSFWMHEGIHFSATTLKPPAYYCVSPPCAAETVLTRRGMNRGPLRVSNCVWHWDVGACWLQGVGSVDQSCSGASRKCLIGLGFGEFGGQVNALGSLPCSSSGS